MLAIFMKRGLEPMRRFAYKLRWCLAMVVLAGCQQEQVATDDSAESQTGEIVGVYDGDTCTLLVGEEEYKIRLEGIDTPEMDQAFGKRAKQALSGYIFGEQVTARLSGQDRYQRHLGTILLDGQNVNLQMVKDGCAWHYKKYSSDEMLAQAELDARAARRGLWKNGDAMPPWDWRSKGSKKTAAKDTTTSDQELREIPATVSYWLNTSSGIRHNRKCHQFGKTKSGRACGTQDGRACKVCGG